MMQRQRSFRIAAGLLLALAGGPVFAADWFPLAEGNTWTYRDGRTGQTFSISVGAAEVMGDKVYHRVRGYVEQERLLRIDERGDLVALRPGGEVLVTPFAPREAMEPVAFRMCAQTAQTAARPGIHDGPAGPFMEVAETLYASEQCADAGTLSEQYAANIGMVRREEQTIAGPVRFDLVAARIGKLTVEARDYAQFTMMSAPVPGTDEVNVTLRLELGDGQPLRLVSPTSQEFELELRDRAGRVLRRWSDGQAFLPVVREWLVNGMWSVTVPLAVPAAQPSEDTEYLLVAWINTTPESPRIAATLPLRVAASGR